MPTPKRPQVIGESFELSKKAFDALGELIGGPGDASFVILNLGAPLHDMAMFDIGLPAPVTDREPPPRDNRLERDVLEGKFTVGPWWVDKKSTTPGEPAAHPQLQHFLAASCRYGFWSDAFAAKPKKQYGDEPWLTLGKALEKAKKDEITIKDGKRRLLAGRRKQDGLTTYYVYLS